MNVLNTLGHVLPLSKRAVSANSSGLGVLMTVVLWGGRFDFPSYQAFLSFAFCAAALSCLVALALMALNRFYMRRDAV